MPIVFISYKKSPVDSNNDTIAKEMARVLEDTFGDRSVFLDTDQIHPGDDWDSTIFDAITDSDVLVLMLTDDVASRWVQREVDFARGCRIPIVPVVVDENDLTLDTSGKDPITKALEALAVPTRQYARALRSTRFADRYNDVIDAIKIAREKTRTQQKSFIDSLSTRWKKLDDANPALSPAETEAERATYVFYPNAVDPHKVRIHLAAGSVTELNNIDVLVNSENCYMQMQRVFAPPSVSRTIRLMGAKGDGINGIIEQDTVQDELNCEVFSKRKKVPVRQTDVFVTRAGDPSSELALQGFRYIYHVAVVNATPKGEERLDGGEGERVVMACVINCLNELTIYNRQNPGTPLKSMVFPLLGSGNAGLNVRISAKSICKAILKWLKENPVTELKCVYINAFRVCDVDETLAALRDLDLKKIK